MSQDTNHPHTSQKKEEYEWYRDLVTKGLATHHHDLEYNHFGSDVIGR